MKLSVLANLYGNKPLDEALQIITGLGVHTVELGAGGYPGKAHCNPEELLADQTKYDAFIDTLKKYGGNREQTAKELKVSKSTLWRLMKKYNINW
mgnify:CR=1 FL=1